MRIATGKRGASTVYISAMVCDLFNTCALVSHHKIAEILMKEEKSKQILSFWGTDSTLGD
jgi:hypothetical protein